MQPDIERCRNEIAGIEALPRSGHPDLQGLCGALMDWHAELWLLEREASDRRKEAA